MCFASSTKLLLKWKNPAVTQLCYWSSNSLHRDPCPTENFHPRDPSIIFWINKRIMPNILIKIHLLRCMMKNNMFSKQFPGMESSRPTLEVLGIIESQVNGDQVLGPTSSPWLCTQKWCCISSLNYNSLICPQWSSWPLSLWIENLRYNI